MDIKRNWENSGKSISEDLREMIDLMEEKPKEKFVPTYPSWTRKYAKRLGMIEGVDFKISGKMYGGENDG